jgi:hypothetical protein
MPADADSPAMLCEKDYGNQRVVYEADRENGGSKNLRADKRVLPRLVTLMSQSEKWPIAG